MTPSQGGVELLDQEPAPTSRRSKVAVGLLVLLLVGVGVQDRVAHASESARVEGCRDTARAALVLADRRVGSMASYVFPALSGAYMRVVRTGLARLVAGAAEKSVPTVTAARATCAAVDVRPWHGELQGRLDACVEALDAQLGWLGEVRRDGTEAFRSTPGSVAGCRTG